MTAMNPHPELVDGVDVDAVAGAVRSCPGVADLASGALGSVVSYLPGRQLPGVRVADGAVTVQVVVRWGVPLPQVGRQVRDAVAPLVGRRRVDVVAADIVGVPGWDDDQATTGA